MRRAHRSRLSLTAALLIALILVPGVASTASAASTTYSAKCSVTLRTGPRTTAARIKVIPRDAKVTVSGTTLGGAFRADCPTPVSGGTWLKVVAVNGKSTSSLYGRSMVYAAKGLFRFVSTTSTPTATAPSTTTYLANCSVRLRGAASTHASTRAMIDANTSVTVAGTVSGGSWKADCKSSVSGSSWYKITAVGGRSVSSLYGVSAVYAAKGLFRLPSSSGFKEGIDVSHWQGWIDWSKVKAAGKTFAIAKASEGIGFEDSSYDRNKAGALGNGLKFGAYHFARPGRNNPVEEADWFVRVMGLQRGMLVPTLDIEVSGGLGPTALTSWTKAFVQRVYARTGVKPMIYTSPSFWRDNLNNSRWFADNGYAFLWIAHWNTNNPSVPGDNWGGRSWTFWQYSETGTVPGISGRVDLNRYRFASFDAVTY